MRPRGIDRLTWSTAVSAPKRRVRPAETIAMSSEEAKKGSDPSSDPDLGAPLLILQRREIDLHGHAARQLRGLGLGQHDLGDEREPAAVALRQREVRREACVGGHVAHAAGEAALDAVDAHLRLEPRRDTRAQRLGYVDGTARLKRPAGGRSPSS